MLKVHPRSKVVTLLAAPAGATLFSSAAVIPPFPSFMGFPPGKPSELAYDYAAEAGAVLALDAKKNPFLAILRDFTYFHKNQTFVFKSALETAVMIFEGLLGVRAPKSFNRDDRAVILLELSEVRYIEEGTLFLLEGLPAGFGCNVRGQISKLLDAIA